MCRVMTEKDWFYGQLKHREKHEERHREMGVCGIYKAFLRNCGLYF